MQVRVWQVQQDIRTSNDTKVDKVTEAVIENLQTRTVYVLRVLGTSMGGEGQKSESVYFTVLGKSFELYASGEVSSIYRYILSD